ncbi:peptidase [Streptomyces sp. WAC 01529]|uniref:alpha/beta hydrolase n=1 Tax=Streptomyces sp. WAC 01529 TaxID=2203205 RepID=UPI000F712CEC|nr:alpha/beta hydrolase [Streptomyces sp. WAC 01529]AZM57245.1 peptidase [Streptomyces sp. WAC 01529]
MPGRPAMTFRHPVRATVALAVTAACAITLAVPAHPVPAHPVPTHSVPAAHAGLQQDRVRWLPCDQVLRPAPPIDPEIGDCAVRQVPRDHARPDAGTLGVVMLRRRASDPARRLGTLFVNPGGPGQSGLHFAYRADKYLSAEVLARYDVIGFDPRGTGQSAAVRCFTSQEAADTALAGKREAPLTRAEVTATLRAARAYTDACARDGGPLLAHMTTADVARDLDLLREGVGAKRLNFAGFSYGSLIGATYANLFPRRTGALILDGNIDPLLRMTDGAEYDRQRAVGAERVLTAFLRACAAASGRCAFGDGEPAAAFAAIRQRLRHGPLTLPDGTTVDFGGFGAQVFGRLSAGDLTGLARYLTTLRTAAAKNTRTLAVGRTQATAEKPAPYRGNDSGNAVNCGEKPYRLPARAWPALAERWERDSPTFGRRRAFDALPCATWPVRAGSGTGRPYTGPWNRPTGRTALVIGNRHDPDTPYAFAERMAGRLANARLLTADMYGHTAMGVNACVDELATRYLTEHEVPTANTACPADAPPFG